MVQHKEFRAPHKLRRHLMAIYAQRNGIRYLNLRRLRFSAIYHRFPERMRIERSGLNKKMFYQREMINGTGARCNGPTKRNRARFRKKKLCLNVRIHLDSGQLMNNSCYTSSATMQLEKLILKATIFN